MKNYVNVPFHIFDIFNMQASPESLSLSEKTRLQIYYLRMREEYTALFLLVFEDVRYEVVQPLQGYGLES